MGPAEAALGGVLEEGEAADFVLKLYRTLLLEGFKAGRVGPG